MLEIPAFVTIKKARNSLQVFFKISSGLTLTDIKTQSQTVVSDMVVFLLNLTAVTSPT